MSRTQSDRVCRSGRLGILAVFFLVLSGCAGVIKPIKTYDGQELPDSQTARLEAPGNIKVIRVNGRDTTSYLLEDRKLDYSLKPGPNTVVFRYRSIWSRSKVRQNDESAVDVVESEPVAARFEARAGETYTFAFSEAKNVRDARRLAEAFSARARIIDGDGQIITESTTDKERRQADKAAQAQSGGANRPDSESLSGTQAESITPSMSTGEALRLLWKRATREEKEAFLRDAFE